MNADITNGLFEFAAACVLISNIVKIKQDKIVKGISIVPVFFFFIWGLWNLYYYPSLNQWWSFYGGVFVTIVNAVWIVMVFHYQRLGRWIHKNKLI